MLSSPTGFFAVSYNSFSGYHNRACRSAIVKGCSLLAAAGSARTLASLFNRSRACSKIRRICDLSVGPDGASTCPSLYLCRAFPSSLTASNSSFISFRHFGFIDALAVAAASLSSAALDMTVFESFVRVPVYSFLRRTIWSLSSAERVDHISSRFCLIIFLFKTTRLPRQRPTVRIFQRSIVSASKLP